MNPIDIVWIRLNGDHIIGAELRLPFGAKRAKHLGGPRKEVSVGIIAVINPNNSRNLLQGIDESIQNRKGICNLLNMILIPVWGIEYCKAVEGEKAARYLGENGEREGNISCWGYHKKNVEP